MMQSDLTVTSDEDLNELVEAARAAVDKDSKDPCARQKLASALLKSKRFSEALDEALWITSLSPASATGWKLLGQAHMGVKHHKAALSAFRKASELEPADESLAFFAAAAEQSLQQTQQQKYSSSLS